MSELSIEYRKISELIPYSKNPRVVTEQAINAVAASFQAFGILVPIVIDKDNVIVCGHTRHRAAQKLGIVEVPTVRADDLSDEQIKAFRLADNKVAEMAVWDLPLLDSAMDDIGDSIDMEQFGFCFDQVYEPNNTTKEIDAEEFDDGEFEYECPNCGFHFDA